MDIDAILGMFIASPWLALLPAALFAGMVWRRRRAAIVVAALAWAAYVPYELAMKLRLLCSGECNIRVDLLLLYPVLAILSLLAVVAFFRGGGER